MLVCSCVIAGLIVDDTVLWGPYCKLSVQGCSFRVLCVLGS